MGRKNRMRIGSCQQELLPLFPRWASSYNISTVWYRYSLKTVIELEGRQVTLARTFVVKDQCWDRISKAWTIRAEFIGQVNRCWPDTRVGHNKAAAKKNSERICTVSHAQYLYSLGLFLLNTSFTLHFPSNSSIHLYIHIYRQRHTIAWIDSTSVPNIVRILLLLCIYQTKKISQYWKPFRCVLMLLNTHNPEAESVWWAQSKNSTPNL